MSVLYDTDILEWSERQADLLRRRAAGELVNEAELDWPHIAEEIGDLGRNQLHTVESLLTQALVHLLKADGWPQARDVESWLADARLFRRQARRRFVPSMQQRTDLAGLYADAMSAIPKLLDDQPPGGLPQTCPLTLDELLNDA